VPTEAGSGHVIAEDTTPMPRKIVKLIRASLLCTAGLLIVVVAAALSLVGWVELFAKPVAISTCG
jgi:hypothetical protein